MIHDNHDQSNHAQTNQRDQNQNDSQNQAEHITREWLMGETEFYKLPQASLVKVEQEAEENPLVKIVDLNESYGIGIDLFNTCSVISYAQSFEIMIKIKEALIKKFPCPDCDGTGEYNHNSPIQNYRGFCYNCDGSGIVLPESEAE